MILHLADVPFFLDELAGLCAAEWKHLDADWEVEAARAEFLDSKSGWLTASYRHDSRVVVDIRMFELCFDSGVILAKRINSLSG